MATTGIYLITNTINSKAYIGKSIDCEHRFYRHKLARTNQAIHSAIKKYGVDAFTFEILLQCEEQYLDFFERAFIIGYESFGLKGYNLTQGGEGTSRPCSSETKEKIRNSLKGRKLSEEMKKKISPLGRKHSQETKDKMSDSARKFHASKRQEVTNG